MAISTNYAFGVAVTQMQDVQVRITKTQSQLATGNAIANPSDNPDANASMQRLQTALNRQAAYGESLTQADNRLANQEASVSAASNVLIRIKELTVQVVSDTTSPQDRKNINIEIKTLRDQLLSLANTRDESGNFVFGGARTGTVPFQADVEGAVSYVGDQSQVDIAIGDQRHVSVGGVGSKVFTGVARDNGGVNTGIGFFQAIDDLTKAIDSGNGANMQRGLGEVDVLQSGFSHALAQIGADRNGIEQQKSIIDATTLRLQTTLSGIKDTDYTVAATDLQKQMLSLQAAQSSFAQTAKMSLFDFIK